MMETKRFADNKAAAVLIGAALALAVALPASTGVGAGDAHAASAMSATDVSCDGTTWKSGITVVHTGGAMSITQRSTSPVSTSRVTYRSTASGNSLTTKTVTDGTTTTRWTSVLPANYTVRVQRATSSNCNGILPGHGNYRFNYTANFSL